MTSTRLLRTSRVAGSLSTAAAFGALEARRKDCQVALENLRKERNDRSKNIGKAKAAGEDIEPLLDGGRNAG